MAGHGSRVLSSIGRQLAPPCASASACAGDDLAPPPPPSAAAALWSAVWARAESPDGASLQLLAGAGSDGLFAEPTGLAVLESGLLVVSDCTTNRLVIVDPADDRVVRTIGGGGGGGGGATAGTAAGDAAAAAAADAEEAFALARPYCVEVLPPDGRSRPEMLAVSDRNNHRVVWVDPATGMLLGSYGSEGRGGEGGQFGGARAAVRVRGKRLVVVENDNNRLQLVSSRPDQAEKIGGTVLDLVAVGGARAPETLTGAGGLSTVSGGWCGAPHELLAISDGHANRVVIVDIHERRDEQQGVVVRTLHGGNGGPRGGRYARFDVPTDVAEPREGLLAVVDRGGGRVVLVERQRLHDVGHTDYMIRPSANSWRSRSVGQGLLKSPVGCCALPGGGLAVADTGNARVLLFPPGALELEGGDRY
eukprot:SAG22_NODE_1671_length_3847_cov_7.686766_1_plen_420_part_00